VVAAVAVVAIVLLAMSRSGEKGYVVRAIFDNGSFMVPGEQVRVAGANVGEVESVDVTQPGEVDSYQNGHPKAIEGKAVIVLNIENPGFQDFRQNAHCVIRPQSLIGEKYVDCLPTAQRAPNTEPAPELKKIPSGEPGAGEYLLPLENTTSAVDPDLINDIQTLPYAQRFRLIFNELGATLAGRGKDVEEAVERANPDLRDADKLLQILRNQRDELAQLASNSEQFARPLAEQRAHVAGFFANAGAAGQATAERGEQLEQSLSKFPHFLREFRTTMRNLQGFSEATTPVVRYLDQATPALTEATRHLGPFTNASTVALKALGNAGEASGPTFAAIDPVVTKARNLARTGVSPTTKLANFLVSTKKTGGWDDLVDLIYNGAGAVNEYDSYGHFVRSLVTLANCTDYVAKPQSGCAARFTGAFAHTSSALDIPGLYDEMLEKLARPTGGTAAASGGPTTSLTPAAPAPAPPSPEIGESEQLGGEEPGEGGEEPGEGERQGARVAPSAPQRALLNYLLGP
jgi:ABC-type transporter Mla subunit MlaD